MDVTSTPATPPPAQPPPLAPGLEAALGELRAPQRTSWIPLFILSGLAFLLVERGSASLKQALIVAGVLLVHELGHAVAMRALGYRDVRIFFVPFFGALTSARARPATRWKQAVVSLAGPVPGIVVAAAVFVSPLRQVPLLREAAWLSVLVNAFNLLPLGFLDGGRLLDGLLFQRHRVLEVLFSGMSALAFMGLAFASQDWVLGVIAVLSLAGVSYAFRRATWAARLRGRLQGGDLTALPRNELELLYSAAVDLGGAQAKARTHAETMRQLHERATIPPATVGATVGFTAAWLLSFVLAAGVGVAGVWHSNPPEEPIPALAAESAEGGSQASLDPARVLTGEEQTVSSVWSIPDEVKDAFARLVQISAFEMADPGQRFFETDTDPGGLPSRRLVMGVVSGDRWLIHYEEGGRAHSYYLAIFRLRGDGGADFEWGCAFRGKAASLDELRSWLQSHDYRDDVHFER